MKTASWRRETTTLMWSNVATSRPRYDSTITTGIITVDNRCSFASVASNTMCPTKNALMRDVKGRDKNIITPGTIIWECAHSPVLTSSWPPDPALQRLTVYFGPSSWVHRSCLPDWHKPETSESESNYRDNYDCDLVRPGFVFKWTHLPWALEMYLLRTRCEPGLIQHTHIIHFHNWGTGLFASWMRHSFFFH